MKFTKKNPEKGYVTNQLLIPKSVCNVDSIKDSLTFYIGEKFIEDEHHGPRMVPKKVDLWDETAHHLIVPRAYFSEQTRSEFTKLFGVEWVEERLESKELSLPDNIVPRDESQRHVLEAMAHNRGGTVHLACGRGKTIIALKYWVTLGRPAIVIVNSAALADQWMRKIRQFVGNQVKIGLIAGGRCDWKECHIVLATVQSLARKRDSWPMQFRRYFGVAFFDEGHHMAAPFFIKAADLFYGQRFSLTATAFRTDGLEAMSMYHLGDIIYQDLHQDLIPDTIFHTMPWRATAEQYLGIQEDGKLVGGMVDRSGKVHHRKLCIELGKIPWRNNLVLNYLEEDMGEGRQVLVLSHSVEHTRALGALARKKWKTTGVVNGVDVDAFDRIPILEKANPVIGTFDLAREALDKDVLDTLHVTTPFGNENDLQQAWGRIQRRKLDKNSARVRVYEDVITVEPSPGKKATKVTTSERQCRLLRTYLRALKYPYTSQKEKTK